MAENIKEHIAKIKAIIGKETPKTTVETTTRADLEEETTEYPLNQD